MSNAAYPSPAAIARSSASETAPPVTCNALRSNGTASSVSSFANTRCPEGTYRAFTPSENSTVRRFVVRENTSIVEASAVPR